MPDGLDYKLADDIPHFDENDKQCQPPETEIFPNAGALIDDTVQVQSLEDDVWDPLALFATPQQLHLCLSIANTNRGKMKLNNILKWRLIIPDANAKNPDQLYRVIPEMEEMDGLVCGWEESFVYIEDKATLVWYWNPIAAVGYIS